jgi:glycosyltransferase involved in cell wall biosynthesis
MTPINILIVVPACNEEESIADTIASIRLSITKCSEACLNTTIVVVCDSCEDQTYLEAKKALYGCSSIVAKVNFRNVGKTRDWGVRLGLNSQTDTNWIAFTDADSLVLSDWMSRQVQAYQCGYDAFFGRVQFESSSPILEKFRSNYKTQTHRYIHGANMGLSLSAFLEVGGIPLLSAHEDKFLVDRLEEKNLSLFWDSNEAVQTSVRMEGRAPEGFAATLSLFAQSFNALI